MGEQEKQLLLIDLCARLPYGVKCCARYNTGNRYNTNIITVIPENGTIVTRQNELHYQKSSLIEDCRPYLRSMSSMTEEEKEELKQEHIKDEKLYAECLTKAVNGDNSMRGKVILHFAADWCNKNHFDYRGLIEKGLALEEPEGMYKTE